MRTRNTRLVLILGALALTAAVLAVALLAGCATGAGPSGDRPSGPPSSAPAGPAPEDLVGTWVVDATFQVQTQPFLTIAADGTWAGSDGCNGVRGTWELESGGAITTTAGPHTLIYCDGKDLPTLFADAKTVAVDGDTLTLMDAAGEVTATLVAGREQRLKPQA
ncbi:META domain-containing protein [Cryobacterium sp. Sr8]|uniref:Heat shock protein HslJ n=1 Tax=Cryobacterium psychrotolerans TaxID=386301 RepID=A0A1G9DSQ7_9MICO|nr:MULTISPECIES: META domain-containing protein [Cryobacterium]TFD44433.1 META domain-containing protein [Cryobacterium sp. TMT1-2-1]TFD77571.1 META domain-containing protein [Cryobacterium sp. Sr8]TFD83392.1 META domain-containing protein [Cryobacterium psychrotolerans]SDK66862.1 Heat shock protein HslJ [Cryobacterium psychrotolerans]